MMTYNNGTCALQFPSSYVAMDAEEMEYVGGGYSFEMSRSTATIIIDVAAIVLGTALSGTATISKLATKIGWNKVKTKFVAAMVKIGVSTKWANAAVDIIKTVTGFSIGAGISYVLDKTDRSGLNGWIQY